MAAANVRAISASRLAAKSAGQADSFLAAGESSAFAEFRAAASRAESGINMGQHPRPSRLRKAGTDFPLHRSRSKEAL